MPLACMMNIISWNQAYGLYPQNTLERGIAVMTCKKECSSGNDESDRFVADVWTPQHCSAVHNSQELRMVPRRVGDDACYVVNLSTSGLHVDEVTMAKDAVLLTEWFLRDDRRHVESTLQLWISRHLRYAYVIPPLLGRRPTRMALTRSGAMYAHLVILYNRYLSKTYFLVWWTARLRVNGSTL